MFSLFHRRDPGKISHTKILSEAFPSSGLPVDEPVTADRKEDGNADNHSQQNPVSGRNDIFSLPTQYLTGLFPVRLISFFPLLCFAKQLFLHSTPCGLD